MDPVLFSALIQELSKSLVGARINKIHQPSADEMVFRLWGEGGERRLYLRARNGDPAIYFTQKRFAHPFTPPRFCQLLRSRLSRIVSVRQYGPERLAYFEIKGRKDDHYRLVVDLRQKTNVVLLNTEDRIVDALWRDQDTDIVPGQRFNWPPDQYSDLRDENFQCRKDLKTPEEIRRWLLAEVAPMSRWLADDIVGQVTDGASLEDVLGAVASRLCANSFRPVIVRVNERSRLRPFLLAGSEEIMSMPGSLSEGCAMIDHDMENPRASDALQKTVSKSLKKIEKRIASIEKDRDLSLEEELLRHHADLLSSFRERLKSGMTEVELSDYTHDPPENITIKLDPLRSPQENIDLKYKQARKLSRSAEHIKRRLREAENEHKWLLDMQFAIQESDDDVERQLLARELEKAGYLRLRSEPKSRTQAKVKEPLLRAKSPAGYDLVWGKNPRGNDHVSCVLTQPDDIWFHAWQRPGCHLVLKRAGRPGDVPSEDLEYAASLAAGYSSARLDNRVEVIVAAGKAVRKPKGARPGLVVVEPFETVRVTPLRMPETHENA